jgi:diguanylate cyclase (GGDEF)-like protein
VERAQRGALRPAAADGRRPRQDRGVLRAPQLGSARDVTERRNLEERLKEEIGIQRRKTIEAAKASVRIWQLTEKIRNVPRLAEELLGAEDEDALLERAGEFLTDPDGQNYGSVSIFLKDGDVLVRRWSTQPKGRKKFNITKNTPYARVARGEGEIAIDPGGVILPLPGAEALLGVVEVHFDEDERILFDASQTVRSGQLDIVRTLANSLGLMITNLRLYQRVQQQTIVDELTGVFNRRFLDNKIKDEVRRAKRYKRPLSVLMLDLDKFKHINDTLGHAQGDETLRELAKILKGQTREIDIVCRYGGDEFTMLLPETDAAAAQRKAERLRKKIAAHAFANLADAGRPLQFSMSIGGASLTEETDSEGELLKRADDALYKSKRDGRNRTTFL